MATWYEQKEQSAGPLRLRFLWLVCRLLGPTAVKLLLYPILAGIYPFAGPARQASRKYLHLLRAYQQQTGRPLSCFHPWTHLKSFADSLVDKINACAGGKQKPTLVIHSNADAVLFAQKIRAQQGCFLICSHIGNIEILQALIQQTGWPMRTMHAFRQMGQNAVFEQFLEEKCPNPNVILHAVEDISIETSAEMNKALQTGQLVMMAADRVSAHSSSHLSARLLNQEIDLPKGVFRFAQMMEHPVFFIGCLKTGKNTYTLYLQHYTPTAKGAQDLPVFAQSYADFCQEQLLRAPQQWYHFFDFFKQADVDNL